MRIIRKSPGKRTTGRAFFRSLEFWHLFFRIVLIVSLIPLAVISFYNHASADDYAFSNYPHHAWEATGSLLGFFQGCLKQLHWSYTSWQGCFTAVILGTLDPVAFGDSWYAAVAFITFGLLIVSNLVFWRTLFGRRADSQTQRRQRMLADIAACVTSLVMIQLVPRALDMFFWWDGAVNYLPFYTSMLLLSAVLIQIYREEQLSAPKLVPAAILSFLSMGGNYATALVNLLLVLSFALLLLVRRRRGWIPYLAILVSGVLGLAVSVLAPGNGVRMEQEGSSGTGSLVQAVIHSISLAGQSIQQQTGVMLLLLLALLIPFFLLLVREWDTEETKSGNDFWSLPALPVLLLFFLIYAASYAPTVYVYGDGGPMRVEDVRFFYMVTFGAVSEFFLIGKVYHALREQACSEVPWLSRWVVSIVAFIVLFTGMYYVLPRENRETLTSLCAARSLLIGEAQRYDREMKERAALLNDPATDGQDVVVKAVSDRPYLLFLYGLELTEDPDYWINRTVAEYYDKKSVTLEDINLEAPE